MDILVIAVPVFIVFAVSAFICFQRYLRPLPPPTPPPKPTLTAEQLLHDLTTSGQAVIRVEVIDAKNLFLRSPRQ